MTTVLFTALIFVAITLAISAAGMRLWIRPKEAMERVTGQTMDVSEAAAAAHPSLAFRDMLQRLGTLLPASPRDVTVMQKRLIRAGIRNQNGIKILYGAKLVFGVAVPLIASTFIVSSTMEGAQKVMCLLSAGIVGFFGPNEYVKWRGRKRQHQVQRGLPNALDLLVVCVESGLGLDQAIVQVSKELEHAHPEISEELAFVNLEMKAGKRRIEALRNLADRTAVDDLKKLVAVLIQADRFGTSIAQSLRGHAEFMRIKARQVAEEKAAKLGVKLVFPIFFCILPTLFVVTVGPMAVKIMTDLAPMFKGQGQ